MRNLKKDIATMRAESNGLVEIEFYRRSDFDALWRTDPCEDPDGAALADRIVEFFRRIAVEEVFCLICDSRLPPVGIMAVMNAAIESPSAWVMFGMCPRCGTGLIGNPEAKRIITAALNQLGVVNLRGVEISSQVGHA